METYKPPRRSALKSYLTDPLLYLGIALIAIGVSIGFLYKKEKTNLAQRVSFLKGNVQIASTTGSDKKAEAPTREVAAEAPAEPVAPPPAPSVAAAAAPAAPAATTKAAAPANGPLVHVYYAEVPRRALEKLYEESQATGQFNSFGDYTAGILPDVQKRIMAPGLKIRVLEKTDKTITKAQQWFTGIRDPELDEDIGLSTFIELAEVENNTFRGNLEILRSWKEGGERAPASIQKNSYPAIFELGPGAGFFIAGVLPRNHVAHEEELTKQGPFEILKSQSFMNKESEFVIFVEFEKKP
jgi:hypothetical protein